MRKLAFAVFGFWLCMAAVAVAGPPPACPPVHEKSVAVVVPELVAPEMTTAVKARGEAVPVIAEVKAAPVSDAVAAPWHVTLMNALIAFLFATLTACIPILVRYMVKKYRLDISSAQAQELDALLMKGAYYAEERAAAAVKAGMSKPSGNQKLDMAVMFVVEGMKAAGLPDKGTVELVKLVESRLGYYGAMGATVSKDDTALLPPKP